jgi:hypothetical protein
MLRILAFFKKLKAKRKKKKKGEEKAPQLPEGNKIAIFGHTNVGKTVFFVMAHEAAREDPEFRLDTKDDQTASELLSNLRLLKGLEVSVSDGARTERRVDRRFPPPTSETKLLNFVAVLNQRKRFDFMSLDYRGEIASIEEQPELKEDLTRFCLESNCVLFFIEPSVIFSDLYRRKQLASFKSLMQLLVDGKRRLPVPVGLVVTKADLFDSFEDDSQAVLVGRSYEYAKSKRYPQFVQRLLDQPHIRRSGRWSKDLRKVLDRLEDFFETLSGLSLDFQVFFVSATGSRPPQKSDDKGTTVFIPPRQLEPIGVREPFKWAVRRVLLRNRIGVLRRITKWVFWLAFIWCLLFSIPNLLNCGFWYPDILKVEQDIRRSGYSHDLSKLSQGELKDFKRRYRKYSNRTFVSAFFGMGDLKRFAQRRFNELEARSPTPKPQEPPDSAYLAEKPQYDKIDKRFQQIRQQINGSSAAYRLETAPGELRAFKEEIEALEFSSSRIRSAIQSIMSKIDKYLQAIECWGGEKTFYISVEGIPRGYGLYVKIGDSRYGKMYDSGEWPKPLTWERWKPVVYSLINEDTGAEAEAKTKSIADWEIEFPEVGATLKIAKRGLDCTVPSL